MSLLEEVSPHLEKQELLYGPGAGAPGRIVATLRIEPLRLSWAGAMYGIRVAHGDMRHRRARGLSGTRAAGLREITLRDARVKAVSHRLRWGRLRHP